MIAQDARDDERHAARETRTADGTIVEPDRRQKPPPQEAAPGPQRLNADTVRSAPLGRPVLVVLVASLIGAAVLLGAYLMIWSSSVP